MQTTFRVMIVLLIITSIFLPGCRKKGPESQTEQQAPAQPSAQPQPPQSGNTQAEKAAVESALVWLALVDVGDYSASWDQAAEFFRNAVPKQQWQTSNNALRKPLGKTLSRKLKSTRYTTTAPGAPDGRYVIIQFDTSFENKKTAVETVTPMLDKDNTWRVSGYYIK